MNEPGALQLPIFVLGVAVKKTVDAAHGDFLVATASGLRWKTMSSSELLYFTVGGTTPA